MILVVLDAGGTLLSASDAVLYRMGLDGGAPASDCDAPARIEQESIGGRFEPDGSFRGTRWRSVTIERGEDAHEGESTPSEPTPDDVTGLRAVVAEMIRRSTGTSRKP